MLSIKNMNVAPSVGDAQHYLGNIKYANTCCSTFNISEFQVEDSHLYLRVCHPIVQSPNQMLNTR